MCARPTVATGGNRAEHYGVCNLVREEGPVPPEQGAKEGLLLSRKQGGYTHILNVISILRREGGPNAYGL